MTKLKKLNPGVALPIYYEAVEACFKARNDTRLLIGGRRLFSSWELGHGQTVRVHVLKFSCETGKICPPEITSKALLGSKYLRFRKSTKPSPLMKICKSEVLQHYFPFI